MSLTLFITLSLIGALITVVVGIITVFSVWVYNRRKKESTEMLGGGGAYIINPDKGQKEYKPNFQFITKNLIRKGSVLRIEGRLINSGKKLIEFLGVLLIFEDKNCNQLGCSAEVYYTYIPGSDSINFTLDVCNLTFDFSKIDQIGYKINKLKYVEDVCPIIWEGVCLDE